MYYCKNTVPTVPDYSRGKKVKYTDLKSYYQYFLAVPNFSDILLA